MRSWSELRTDEFLGLDPEATVAILPVAAIEQHGPHLPVGTDALILDGVLERVATAASGVTALRLPLQAVGNSLEHVGFAGTLHQDPETLLAHWMSLGRSVRRAGVRKLMILNSHGGQPQIVDLVAMGLRTECAMLVSRVQTFGLGVPENLFPADELRFGLHGGEVETSMMLALRPELVRMEAADHFKSAAAEMAESFELLGAEEPVGMAWAAQDLHPEGVTGDASQADAARGAQLLDHLACCVGTVLQDMGSFSLDRLREPRAGSNP